MDLSLATVTLASLLELPGILKIREGVREESAEGERRQRDIGTGVQLPTHVRRF